MFKYLTLNLIEPTGYVNHCNKQMCSIIISQRIKFEFYYSYNDGVCLCVCVCVCVCVCGHVSSLGESILYGAHKSHRE